MTITFVISAHVDTGKSTILGKILCDIGYLDKHTISKVFEEAKKDGMEPWKYARILDTDTYESMRGKTMNSLSLDFYYNGIEYCMIDTPGHKDRIPSLIQAISIKDTSSLIGITIASAQKGEFESGWINGNSKENILIMRSLGISRFILLINKMDTIDWDLNKYSEISSVVSTYIKSTGVKDLICIPVSGWTGEGLLKGFQDHPSLFDCLSKLSSISRPSLSIFNVKPTNKITVKTLFFDLPKGTVITRGYRMVGHIVSPDIDIPINIIISYMKDLLIKKNDGKLHVMTLSIPTLKIGEGNRILLRTSDNQTLGTSIVSTVH